MLEIKERIEYYLNTEKANGFILTFDDGYKEHYKCSQYLNSMGCNGVFFIATKTQRGEVLSANIAHIILGSSKLRAEDIANNAISHFGNKKMAIYNEQELSLSEYGERFDERLVNSDTKYDKMIKRLIQRDSLNEGTNEELIKYLWSYVGIKISISEIVKMYLNENDMHKMKGMGMSIGSHTVNHMWLSRLDKKKQYKEITESFKWLEEKKLIRKEDIRYFSYPYGDYNDTTIDILSNSVADYSFTCRVGKAEMTRRKKGEAPFEKIQYK